MDNKELKVKQGKVFTGVFGGSSPFKYQNTDHLEAGIGSSKFHSITRMSQYQDSSFEELRTEDYNASGGIFGAKIKKLANAICNPLQRIPFYYGRDVNAAIRSITHTHQEDSTAASPPGVGDPLKIGSQCQKAKVNLALKGNHQNVTVLVESGSEVNFFCSGNVHMTIRNVDTKQSTSESKFRSKSSDTHRKPSNDQLKKKTEKKYFDRKPKSGDKH